MVSRSQVVKWLPRLAPFLITSILYISHFDRLNISGLERLKESEDNSPSAATAILKCLPIICLIGFVAAHEEPHDTTLNQKRYKASIAIGLSLGCLGDACLVFHETFIIGMLAFAAGHAFYIYAFGFKPFKPLLGLALFILSSIAIFFVRDLIKDDVIKEAMPFYSIFLVTMTWRSLAKVGESSSGWTVVGAIGGLLFLISDFILVLQFDLDIPYGELMVISTYYLSQMCTALTILDAQIKQE